MPSFSFSTALALLSMAAYAVVGAHADIIAFSDLACTESPGLNVACDGSCHSYTGRQSFEVIEGGLHCVTVFSDSGCNDLVATFPNQGNGLCQATVIGAPSNSFRCSSTDVCDTQ